MQYCREELVKVRQGPSKTTNIDERSYIRGLQDIVTSTGQCIECIEYLASVSAASGHTARQASLETDLFDNSPIWQADPTDSTSSLEEWPTLATGDGTFFSYLHFITSPPHPPCLLAFIHIPLLLLYHHALKSSTP